MDLFWQGIKEALRLILTSEPEVLKITVLSLYVSGVATAVSLALGMPFGLFLALREFPGRQIVMGAINTGMGLPPVVVGLFVAMFLWRSGPLGFLEILYTPTAMIVAQVIIAFPLVAGLTTASIQQLDPRIGLQAKSLGASGFQTVMILVREARLALLAAIMAGFGGVISEVGAVMMVGGNLKGLTRVLTTATVMEVRMGHFDMAIALGLILLGLSFSVNFVLTLLQQGGRRRWTSRPLR